MMLKRPKKKGGANAKKQKPAQAPVRAPSVDEDEPNSDAELSNEEEVYNLLNLCSDDG